MSHSISSFSSSRSSHLTRLFSLPVRHFSVSFHLFSADDKRPSSSVKNDSSPDKKPDDANNSAEKKPDDANNSAEKKPDDANNSALINTNGLYKRFHKAYKNYGKVLIGFHSVTYCVYFTSFLGISYGGLDVVVVLEWLRDHVGFPQAIIDKLHSSGAGHFAVAFILCKVITPIRYLTTLVGTKYTADYLRRRGYMAPVPKGDNIGELAKESQKLIETKSAEIKTKFAKGRRSGEARMRKTNTAVKDKLKRTPKR